jgi:hypothetical protein
MAPQRKEIDWTAFENLCQLQCTQTEIASFLKMHIDTLRDRVVEKYEDEYSNVYKKLSETGKCSLRRNQFVLSKKNTAMAIWLGKIWLGQRDVSQEVQLLANTMANKLLEQIAPSKDLIPSGDNDITIQGRPVANSTAADSK